MYLEVEAIRRICARNPGMEAYLRDAERYATLPSWDVAPVSPVGSVPVAEKLRRIHREAEVDAVCRVSNAAPATGGARARASERAAQEADRLALGLPPRPYRAR